MYYKYLPHKWIVLLVRADWLVRKSISSIIYLRAAKETQSLVESLISDHFSVCWKK